MRRVLYEKGLPEYLPLYLQEVARIPLLTVEEERQLGREIKYGDEPEAQEAKDKLIVANLRLVLGIARRFVGHGLAWMDLIQQGNLGLLRAASKFDYEMGCRFSTYATWWIRQSIIRGIAEQSRIVRLPCHTVEELGRLGRSRERFLQEEGRMPNLMELARESALPVEHVTHLLKAELREPVSLEVPVGDDEDASDLSDFIVDNDPLPEEYADRALLNERIEGVLGCLSGREQRVIELRFGLRGEQQRTLAEVGRELGLSRERIRQIEKQALDTLREQLGALASPAI